MAKKQQTTSGDPAPEKKGPKAKPSGKKEKAFEQPQETAQEQPDAAQDAPKESEATQAQAEPDESPMLFLREETLTEEFPIDDAQRIKFGKEMSNLLHRKASLDYEKKEATADFTRRAKDIDKQLHALQHAVDYGRAEQTIPVKTYYNKTTGYVVYVGFDGETIKTRPPKPGEQFPLPKQEEAVVETDTTQAVKLPECYGGAPVCEGFEKPYEDCDKCPVQAECEEELDMKMNRPTCFGPGAPSAEECGNDCDDCKHSAACKEAIEASVAE